MATSMATTRQQIQRYLQAFDFKHLFQEPQIICSLGLFDDGK